MAFFFCCNLHFCTTCVTVEQDCIGTVRFCNTWCCFCVSRLLQLPLRRRKSRFSTHGLAVLARLFALRLHKWLCVVPQQPACFYPRRNFATNGLFCLPAVFYTRIGVFALRILSFVGKVWRLWFVGPVSTIIACQVSLFAIPLPWQRCFWHTGWQFCC